ncbi:MAG: DHH family phosphoesterase, partial [Clostridiales bacterium]|nr:DHH family phosphoesterase [Clostridiales bacterium]
LSIGVGQGDTMRQSEEMARQALEMALGRGGDQAAVKTRSGFDFYGGVSKGVEKRTKVRTRVVASALSELIAGSDNVLVMGHRFSDLDCLGSAAAMAAAARGMGRPAYAVARHKTTLAAELIDRYDAAGRGDLFIEPEEAMELLNRRTLLIVTDTHNPQMLEDAGLYRAAGSVVVIDHHRKMVEHIDNAVVFYHEPYASSASEMVAELVQYMPGSSITRLEAEALLAGIMLDTRSFVMKAGVRTFEAAAYLRRLGADTIEVKKMFAENMETYRAKADIIAQAELYRKTAIACCERDGSCETRIAASQAADELLYIKGVDASFTLFTEGNTVNISARSLGDFNVQLVMETIGGGGHMTMAGAQLEDVDMAEARRRLTGAIDRLLADREHALAVQQKQNES